MGIRLQINFGSCDLKGQISEVDLLASLEISIKQGDLMSRVGMTDWCTLCEADIL
jgi:hypothetical protein